MLHQCASWCLQSCTGRGGSRWSWCQMPGSSCTSRNQVGDGLQGMILLTKTKLANESFRQPKADICPNRACRAFSGCRAPRCACRTPHIRNDSQQFSMLGGLLHSFEHWGCSARSSNVSTNMLAAHHYQATDSTCLSVDGRLSDAWRPCLARREDKQRLKFYKITAPSKVRAWKTQRVTAFCSL